MSQIDGLSSVGRELFLKSLIASDVSLYLNKKKDDLDSFDKKSSAEIKSSLITINGSRLLFPKNCGIEPLLVSGNNLRVFFYVKNVGYFFDVSLASRLNSFESSVPLVIKKMDGVKQKKNSNLSGEVSYAVNGSKISMPLILNESFDILTVKNKSAKTLGCGGDYLFSGNIEDYLSGITSEELQAAKAVRPPVDIVFLSQDYVVLGEKFFTGFFCENQSFLVSLDFALSPIIKRSIKFECTVREIFFGKGGSGAIVCTIESCREEDRRFLSDGLARFI